MADHLKTLRSMTLIGHGSLKFTTTCGMVIYVDPSCPGDYSAPAEVILVTHHHGDHDRVELVSQKPGASVIQSEDAFKDGTYINTTIDGVSIAAVPAENQNHKRTECVGYVLTFANAVVYCAGDTSIYDGAETLKAYAIDYAFLPTDGVYNMSPQEATRYAEIIGAKTAFPIHNDPQTSRDGVWRDTGVSDFTYPGAVVLKVGETFTLP